MEEKIYQIIAENLNVDRATLNENTSFKEDLKADSIDLVSVVMEIENAFNISIDDTLLVDIKTIGDVFAKLKKIIG